MEKEGYYPGGQLVFFFLLKKAFFDAWDNLASIIVSNYAVFVVAMLGLWPMTKILESGSLAGFAILIILIPLLYIVVSSFSLLISKVADYKRVTFGDVPEALKQGWKHGLFLSVIGTLFFLLSYFGMIYYSSLRTTLGLAAMALLFWITLSVYLILIWFFPVRNRLTGSFGKHLKKSALIMLDNLGLSLFIGLFVIPAQLILWPLTAFGGFGPAGIQLYLDDALRLLLFKYDWLEENPEAKKKDVPWYELLIDERERVGKRSLKGMIFPWKE